MKISLLLFFVALGVLGGVIVSGDDWGLRAVMGGFGALVGAAIGGALAKIGNVRIEKNEIPGLGTTSKDIAANFWRDRGQPPR